MLDGLKIAFRTVQGSAYVCYATGKGQLVVINSVQPLVYCYRFDGQVGRLQAAPVGHPSNRPTSSNLTTRTRPPARVYARDVMLNAIKCFKTLLTRLDGWTGIGVLRFVAVQPVRPTLFCCFEVGRI